MNQITDFLINDAGVSQEILVLILFIPIISMIIGIARYYIGIKTFSLYVPLLLSSAFYLLKVTYQGSQTEQVIAGALWGTFFTFIVLLGTFITSKIIGKVRLHYFPKISLTLSSVAIILVLIATSLAYFEFISLDEINFTSIILISLISERFVTTLSKKNVKTSLKLSIETILLSLFCYLIMVIEPLKTILLDYPIVIFLTLPISYLVGKYTGLRVTEYMRFQDILDEDESSE